MTELRKYDEILESIKQTINFEDVSIYRDMLFNPFMLELRNYLREKEGSIPGPFFIVLAEELFSMGRNTIPLHSKHPRPLFVLKNFDKSRYIEKWSFSDLEECLSIILDLNPNYFNLVFIVHIFSTIINANNPMGKYFREFFEARLIKLPKYLLSKINIKQSKNVNPGNFFI